MKRPTYILPALALLCANLSSLAHSAAGEDELPGICVQPATYFYTGKPYDDDLGSYVFAYRGYDPETKRWTTADPSGFPDGANNQRYSPQPTISVDPLGLQAADPVTVSGVPTAGASGSFLSITTTTKARQVGTEIRAEMVVEWSISAKTTGWVVQQIEWQ